jgi:hypothetical protein
LVAAKKTKMMIKVKKELGWSNPSDTAAEAASRAVNQVITNVLKKTGGGGATNNNSQEHMDVIPGNASVTYVNYQSDNWDRHRKTGEVLREDRDEGVDGTAGQGPASGG